MRSILSILLVFIYTISWAQVTPQRLAAADAFALAATAKDEASITALASYLKKAGPTETEQVRAVYSWVAHNIVYDAPLFFSQQGRSAIASTEQMKTDPRFVQQVPENVLHNRKAVCHGYSRLVEALCAQMGIPVMTVNGIARSGPNGLSYAAHNGPNHAWNAVKADGAWHLLDATWAAGHLDNNNRFVAGYSDSLFFQAPAKFVRWHLPSDPTFQMLSAPVTKAAFFEGGIIERIAASAKGSYAYVDTLNLAATQPEQARTYKSCIRALAYDDEAIYARLKIAEYHAQLAIDAMSGYEAGIQAYNRQEISGPTPQMLTALDQAESHLTYSRRMIAEVPRSQLSQIPAAKENLRNLDNNLKNIAQQKSFWAKNSR